MVANVGKMLALLAEYHVSATFFVLGSVAEQHPDLVPMIAAAGHEIASHGYSHRLVGELDRASFQEEIRVTAAILEQQSGQRPTGFRAPQWSLPPSHPWGFAVLKEEGYRYDSSCNPLPFVGDRRGARTPFEIATPHGCLQEVPPLVTSSPIGNLPTGGGWGFRVFPLAMVEASVQRLNEDGMPAVFYLHPRELDPCGPRLKLSPLRSFAAYGPPWSAEQRLRCLLQCFRFTTLQQVVETWQTV